MHLQSLLSLLSPPRRLRQRLLPRRPLLERPRKLALLAIWALLPLLALLPPLASANLCPHEMDVKLPKTQEAPAGWEQLAQQAKLPLRSVRLFDGPPDSAPEIRPKVRQPHYWRWDFRIASKQGPVSASPAASDAGTGEAAAVRPLWIKCSYGDPAITLTRPMPADFSACSLKCAETCQLWCR